MFTLVEQLITCLQALAAPQRGQTTTELGAVLVFVSIVAVGILRTLGTNVTTLLNPLLGSFWGV
jgi:Flp pilus assembly pilin Flp